MYFTYLKAKNFQSFKDLHYEFRKGIPVLIQGENLTDTGQESNGSGKSVLMSVTEYCILHTISKKVTDKDLVFWWDGTDQGEVELGIHCPIRKETLLIQRVISIKNGGSSQISINGVVKYAFSDKMVNEIDRFIIEWIGISKEDLQNFFILSKFKYTSFFTASNTNLTQLIGRFSNSDIIQGIDKDIESEVVVIDKQRSELALEQQKLYGMLEVHQTNLERELTVDKSQLVIEKLESIDNLILEENDKIIRDQTQIGVENDKILQTNEKLQHTLETLQQTELQLKKVNEKTTTFTSRYEEVDNKTKTVKTSKESVERKIESFSQSRQETLTLLQEIELNLTGSVTCPKCKFEFVVGKPDVDVESERETRELTSNLITQIDEQITEAKKELTLFDPQLKGLRQDRLTIESEENEFATLKRNINNRLLTIEREKGELENEVRTSERKITEYRQSILDIEKHVKSLVLSKSTVTVDTFDNKDRITAINEEIKKCRDSIAVNDQLDKTLLDLAFEKRTWSVTFREFNQYLSIKTLKVLQGYANKFLEEMGLDLRVQLEGYKLKADGTFSEKITAYIVRDGNIKEFGNFSGGEKVRLEAAIILTIQHAINSTHPYGGLDYLSVDEIFESADGMGIATLTRSLMNLGKTILLTTHIPVMNYECEAVKVVKVNRISYLYNG